MHPAFLAALDSNFEPFRAALQQRDLLAALGNVKYRKAAPGPRVQLDERIVDHDFLVPFLACRRRCDE
jgi:hypothetical protein